MWVDRGAKSKAKGGPKIGLAILLAVFAFFLLRSTMVDLAVAEGDSMLPSIKAGDLILIFKAAYGLRNPLGGYFLLWSRPKNRDVVAALRPGEDIMLIKRVSGERPSADLDGPVFLLGDNIYASIDSREFGPVPMNNVLGKAFSILGP